jgi:hypothetical protein
MGDWLGKPEEKTPLGSPRHGWMNSIKLDHREIAWVGMDWIDLAQDRKQSPYSGILQEIINIQQFRLYQHIFLRKYEISIITEAQDFTTDLTIWVSFLELPVDILSRLG